MSNLCLKTKNKLFFLHLPKTGGTTLGDIIKQEYGAKNTLTIDQQFHKVVKPPKISDEDKQAIKVIKGHFCFGYHQFFNSSFSYFTLVRDPIKRVISDYNHIYRIPQHWLHHQVTCQNMTLEEYVISGTSKLSENGQTRFLSGMNTEIDFGQCSREHLELAKNNLDQYFSVVGLTERFDESLLLLQKKFGWSDDCFLYEKKRVNKSKKSHLSLSQKQKKTIEKFNLLDIELYEYAKAIFEKQIREIDIDIEISKQVKFRQNVYRLMTNAKKAKIDYSKKIRNKLGV